MAEIRYTTGADSDVIETIYREAFPDEDLVPLVRQLLDAGEAVHSLVALAEDGSVAGYMALTPCAITDSPASAWLLGPLAVAPVHQQRGIGTALISHARHLADSAGAARVLVLGDPEYYRTHGFEAECEIAPPYDLPQSWDGAWQSVKTLHRGEPVEGKLIVPEFWQDEKLWLP